MKNYFLKIMVSAVFIFSGLFKLYDFTNTALFFKEIFPKFNNHVIYLFLITFILTEIILGICLIFFFNRKIKQISISLLFFFIILSIYFWLGNQSNCGCFGTAVIFSPTSTIIKNIILIIIILITRIQ